MKKMLFNYLKFWASGYLRRTKPEIIAVTGSVGKTSAKEAIFEVLKIKFGFEIRKSCGNLNNETGVPLAILNFQKSPNNFLAWIGILFSAPVRSFGLKSAKVLVLELAADKPGDIKYLTSFVSPKIAVLTAIGPAHLTAFGTLDKVVEEKSDLLRALSADGWAVINLDNELSRKVYYGGNYRKKSYAIGYEADVSAENIKTEISNFQGRTQFDLKIEGKKETVVLPSLGNFTNVSAALAGAAVGQIYGLLLGDIARGLKNIRNEEHRINVLQGKNDTTIIDDSYNANPLSMKAALDLLKTLPKVNRKIAVLGAMREIGHLSQEAHQEISQLAREIADLTVEVGSGKKYDLQKNFKTTLAAAEFLLEESQPGDIILIKASRAVGLDKIVERLRV